MLLLSTDFIWVTLPTHRLGRFASPFLRIMFPDSSPNFSVDEIASMMTGLMLHNKTFLEGGGIFYFEAGFDSDVVPQGIGSQEKSMPFGRDFVSRQVYRFELILIINDRTKFQYNGWSDEILCHFGGGICPFLASCSKHTLR